MSKESLYREALQDTAATAEQYAFICELGNWMPTSKFDEFGLSRARMNVILHAVVNYVRREEFLKIGGDAKMSYLPSVPRSDIENFLRAVAENLGIEKVDKIPDITDFVIDNILRAGSHSRRFQPFDQQNRKVLPREAELSLANIFASNIELHSRFVYAYGTIVDYRYITGNEMISAETYLLGMAVESGDLENTEKRIAMLLAQIRRERQKLLRDGAEIAENYLSLDWEEFNKSRVSFGNEFRQRLSDLQTIDGKLKAFREGEGKLEEKREASIERCIAKLGTCMAEMTTLTRENDRLNEQIKELVRLYSKKSLTGNLFDFEGVVFNRLSTTSAEGIIELFEHMLLPSLLADPQKSQADFKPAVYPGDWCYFPIERRQPDRGTQIDWYDANNLESTKDSQSRSEELNDLAREVAAAFVDWLKGIPGQKGRISSYLKTLTRDELEVALRPSVFTMVFQAGAKRSGFAAWKDIDQNISITRETVVPTSTIDDPDKVETSWNYTDFEYEIGR